MDLNAAQQKAVITTEGRIRVAAGAGSGKTRVIAHHYAYLVNKLGIAPGNILCTTFTNKAAKEMSFRIGGLLKTGSANDLVCTVHGFCVRFLRKEIFRIGFPSSFPILDEQDSKLLGKEVMEEVGINRTRKTINNFLKDIAFQKSHQPYVADLFVQTESHEREESEDVLARYAQKQLKLFALDFQDLIYVTLYILQNFSDARAYWCTQLNYILVDEAQDLSSVQWKLMETLASENGNLFVVGDPDQAIYEWRGASPHLFVEFRNDETITLGENYRSTPNILHVANSVICNNKKRLQKELFTHNAEASMVCHYHAKSEEEEACWIVNRIKCCMETAGTKFSDFAILYRAAYLSRRIEQALINEGIKYVVWGGLRFFERREIKDTLAYLRLIDTGDDLSFLRVINTPARGLGKVFVKRIKELAAQDALSYYETLRANIKDPVLDRPGARKFLEMIDECRERVHNMRIDDLSNYVLDKSGLKEDIRNSGDEDRLDNLAELADSIRLYEEIHEGEDISLTTYLQDIALYTNADYRKENETVKLMTIHQAKGLEFPYVFVIGMSEGIFPSYRASRERSEAMEEERRLMYVAITRAEKALFLSESEGFSLSTNSPKYPSRFIREIEKAWLVTEGDIDEELWRGTDSLCQEYKDEEEEQSVFEVGETVKHEVFGDGIVLSVIDSGAKYLVKFEKGKRTLMATHLEKAEEKNQSI